MVNHMLTPYEEVNASRTDVSGNVTKLIRILMVSFSTIGYSRKTLLLLLSSIQLIDNTRSICVYIIETRNFLFFTYELLYILVEYLLPRYSIFVIY